MQRLRETERTLIDLIFEASKAKIVEWKIDSEDPNREISRSVLGEHHLTIEVIYFPRAWPDRTYERVLVELTAFRHTMTYARGTEEFEIITSCIDFSMKGTSDGSKEKKRLDRGIVLLRDLVNEKDA